MLGGGFFTLQVCSCCRANSLIFRIMYIGFKKIKKSESSEVIHLSHNNFSTLCGKSVKEDWNKCDDDNLDKNDICKNCRRSILSKGAK